MTRERYHSQVLCTTKLKSTHKVRPKGVDKAAVHIGVVHRRQQANVIGKARVEHLGELRIGRHEIQVVRVLQIDVDHLLCVATPLMRRIVSEGSERECRARPEA